MFQIWKKFSRVLVIAPPRRGPVEPERLRKFFQRFVVMHLRMEDSGSQRSFSDTTRVCCTKRLLSWVVEVPKG
jgi:hypothetical protein